MAQRSSADLCSLIRRWRSIIRRWRSIKHSHLSLQLTGHPANDGAKALELLLLEPDEGSWNQNMTSSTVVL